MTDDTTSLDISPELEQALNTCINLPSLPEVALKIIDASKDPDITLHEVSSIISSDPAISAKLLKVANSPLYSQRRSLNNLREALTLLGFNASLTIALSFSLHQSLGKTHAVHESYWKRSILAALIARILGVHLKVHRLEELFLASLLQDIGILAIQCIKNSPYLKDGDSLNHAERIKLENEILGVDHSFVGAWLLKSWNLPEYLIDAVHFSHSLNSKDNSTSDASFHYCMNLSGNLADVWLTEHPGELLLSILNVTKNALNINNVDLNNIIVEINDSLPDISKSFEMFLVGDKERELVLNEARELLLERSIHTIKQSEADRRYIDSVTERVEKIEKESRLDHLTKIYNRQHIEKLLELEYEESNINQWPLSIAFIDIDDFKFINDTYGHLTGDDVLKLIATFFENNIRQTDVLARYGGDEFLLMLPGATKNIAKSLLERLLVSFKNDVKLKSADVDVDMRVSIGLATQIGYKDFNSLRDFIAAADKALYKSKAEGKNCLSVY